VAFKALIGLRNDSLGRAEDERREERKQVLIFHQMLFEIFLLEINLFY